MTPQNLSHGGLDPQTIDRFWSKVQKGSADECWLWQSELQGGGYGRFVQWRGGRKNLYAHRVSYLLTHGEIPAGMDIDHNCHNLSDCPGGKTCPHRRCVNPSHLRAVSRKVNLAAGRKPVRKVPLPTHCKWGHPWDEENTYIVKSTGTRMCRACNTRRQKETQRRKRAA